ncbi:MULTISPECIES: GNAT family N-acetyltransferase [Streptomyces]|uniref:Lysine N-acyltransferase MbtK n=1 Tax=Streptomyces sviceus (strain ATCC 29083 / DSM 924 / JCM 4929 / NBRC 13980 / NCIMB 11184 / NRRL 5439 / UC 5370) TaxID=463191 RepID=B5I8F6_STRX2|nr:MULTISPECIES: GNAT family N-acetyltransferase [Streptomyces]EDY61361.2 rhizobactin siderophore biosynthesis protein rhbD [Streptomyces sviceus ATCC 29083]MYT08851.1 GNAT family N-acetyltransferase [Streptomyces sp. SID5470]
MSPSDRTADAVSALVPDIGTGTCPAPAGDGIAEGADRSADWSTDQEDTLDLRLPDEFLALFETEQLRSDDTDTDTGPGPDLDSGTGHGRRQQSWGDTTAPASSLTPADDDLLDGVAEWGPITTPVGAFQLVPVRVERDLPLVCRWMNDPAVSAFWELAGPQNVTEDHLRSQLADDGRSVPCLGVLEGAPMSYWEIYRADLDPLARHYPARPHDTGIHLLIGAVTHRGRGLGSTLLRAVADLVLDRRSACARVVAEPDLRNIPSVTAFLNAGFRFSAEVDLPAKRAALMIRDRALRDLL